MKKLLFIFAAGLIAHTATAQDLPQPSPSAKVEQTVGLTEMSIEYSRPSVKGRVVFGDLVPYDKVWRLGANACTKITTSTEVMFQGKTLSPGTYAVFAIPGENGMWQFIINKDIEQWGAGNYDAEKNVINSPVKAINNPFTETFTIAFTNITTNSGNISIAWDKKRIDVPFSVATEKIAQKNIDTALKKGEDLDKVYNSAASYYFNSMKDNKKAMIAIAKGLEVKETHKLHYLRAQIMQSEGKTTLAVAEAKVAHKLALEAESQGWADYIKENMEAWEK